MRFCSASLVASVCLIATNCSVLKTKGDSRLSIQYIRSLDRDGLSKDKTRELFGEPSQVIALKTGEVWRYNEDSRLRLSFFFDSKSNPEGFTWFVRNGDPEQDLKSAVNQFPNSNFQSQPIIVTNPHYVPDECTFEDNRIGVSIEFRRTRKEVSALSFWSTKRTPATEETIKPRSYCIGDNCSKPMTPVKWDSPDCKIPKGP